MNATLKDQAATPEQLLDPPEGAEVALVNVMIKMEPERGVVVVPPPPPLRKAVTRTYRIPFLNLACYSSSGPLADQLS